MWPLTETIKDTVMHGWTRGAIKRAIRGLNYLSEADSWWHVIDSVPAGVNAFEVPFDEFFDHLEATQHQSRQYHKLRLTLQSHLTDLKVYKLFCINGSRYDLMIFVVGFDGYAGMKGVQTLAVET